MAGHHVADAWLSTRARVEEGLLAAGAHVVEGNPKGSTYLRPVKKHTLKKKPKTINVDKNVSESVAKRIKGLTSLFIGMGAFKPAGILTDSRRSGSRPALASQRRRCRTRRGPHWIGW